MNPKDVILSERNQSQKTTHERSKLDESLETESRTVVVRDWGEQKEELSVNG